MIHVLTAEEMRAADAQVSAADGGVALMRDAGARIAEWIEARVPGGGRIVAFAGPGNNGGDAFAACAALPASYERIVYALDAASPSAARSDAESRARAAGTVVRTLPERDAEAYAALDGAVLGIDALFGTGARLPLGERYRPAARALDRSRLPVLAIDIPSGIDADTGATTADCVHASATLTLAAVKPGVLFAPGSDAAGEVWIGDIGISGETLQAHARTFAALDDDALLAMMPVRPPEADKRSAGAPLIIAGSEQFPGAAVLCARSASRAGAGYVTVVTSRAAAPALRAHLVEQVVVTIPDGSAEEAADDLCDVARRNSSVAIGPGLALDEWTGAFVRAFVRDVQLPIVLDASALFHFAKHLDMLRDKACVVTPHAGEFARLSGKGTVAPGTRVARVREFVDRTGITTLLKGNATLISDARRTWINTTGTNALATAGTGDVLTGIIATLLSQGCTPVEAACVGAYWHGRAGRAAAGERPVGVVAGDIPEFLARAMPRSPSSTRASLRRVYA